MTRGTKIFRIIICVLLALTMLWSAVWGSAFILLGKNLALTAVYDIYVAGKLVNAFNADDILGDGTVYYDSFLDDNLTSKQKNEGTLRVRYDVVEDGTSMDYTIIGLQRNGKLEEVEELDLTAAVSGHLTPEEMLGYAESSNTTALITAAVIALAFAIPGVIMFVKAGKKRT